MGVPSGFAPAAPCQPLRSFSLRFGESCMFDPWAEPDGREPPCPWPVSPPFMPRATVLPLLPVCGRGGPKYVLLTSERVGAPLVRGKGTSHPNLTARGASKA